jgi:hypothetical protein
MLGCGMTGDNVIGGCGISQYVSDYLPHLRAICFLVEERGILC